MPRVFLCPNQLAPAEKWHDVEAGVSLAEIAPQEAFSSPTRAILDGEVIPKEEWAARELQDDSIAIFRQRARDVVGGLIVIAAFLTKAIPGAGLVAAAGAKVGGFYGAVAGAIIGGAAITSSAVLSLRALTKPPSQGATSTKISQSPSFGGTQNEARIFAPVPRNLGFNRLYPPYAARPYLETWAGEIYQRLLFTVGVGPNQISEMKIGDVPLGDFDPAPQTKVWDGRSSDGPLELYSRDAVPVGVQKTFEPIAAGDPDFGEWLTASFDEDVEEIQVILQFPRGVLRFDSGGNKEKYTFGIEIEYKLATSSWPGTNASLESTFSGFSGHGQGRVASIPPFTGILFSGKDTAPFGKTLRWEVPKGRYDVRIRRWEGDQTITGAPQDPRRIEGKNTSSVFADINWLQIVGFKFDTPPVVAPPGVNLTLIEARVQLNEQQGSVSQFNCIAKSELPTFSSGAWQTPSLTNNPAWCAAAVWRDPGLISDPIPDSDIPGEQYEAWADENDKDGFECNAIVDFDATQFQLFQDVAQTGVGAFNGTDGNFGVLRDRERQHSGQIFSPRNCSEMEGSFATIDTPHAYRVEFRNEENNYELDTMFVYRDGFAAESGGGKVAATRVESMRMPFVTKPSQVAALGTRFLRILELRPETWTFKINQQQLTSTIGDLCDLSFDGALIGQKWGRIHTVTGDPVTEITIDEKVTFLADTDYEAEWRTLEGGVLTKQARPIVNPSGTTSSLIFETPIASSKPKVGDLVIVGERDKMVEQVVVRQIEPLGDLEARVTVENYGPGVFAPGPPGPFNPVISTTVFGANAIPPKPIIDLVVSDESALFFESGELKPRIRVLIRPDSGVRVPTGSFLVEYRASGVPTPDPTDPTEDVQTGWRALPLVPIGKVTVDIEDVEQGARYDIRARAISKLGLMSEFVEVDGHKVIGKGSVPPAPIHPYIGIGPRLIWDYPTKPLDFAGFAVRISAGSDQPPWGSMPAAHIGLLGINELLLDESGGTWTAAIRAEDSIGLQSDPVYLTFDLNDTQLFFDHQVDNQDEHGGGFTGTKTDCTVNGGSGDLEADAEANQFWVGGNHWNRGANYWQSIWKPMEYEFTFNPIAAGAGGNITLGRAVAGEDVRVLVQLPGGADFIPLPGIIRDIEDDDYTFKVTVTGGLTRGVVSALEVFVHGETIVEFVNDTDLGTTGLGNIPLTKDFTTITTVVVTISDNSTSAIGVRVLDKAHANGPQVEALDSGDNRVQAVVDAWVEGF